MPVSMVVALQRVAGNRAVSALVRPSVQRLPGAEGEKATLATAIGTPKANWIAAHPVESVSVWVQKSSKDLSAIRNMGLATFKTTYPFPVTPSPEPAVSPPSQPLPSPLPSPGGGPVSSSSSTSSTATPEQLPSPLPLVSLPSPSPSPSSTPDPAAEFGLRLTAFNTAIAKTTEAESKKAWIVDGVGRAAFGPGFKGWATAAPAEYAKVWAKVPGVTAMKAALVGLRAQVKLHSENASLPAPRKLEMITWAEGELARHDATLAKIEAAAQARAAELSADTQGHYTGTPAPDQSKILAFLELDVPKRLVGVGARRSDYRSKFDKGEGNTFGASYTLNNSPFVVHIHSAGSGTILSAMSIKWLANEHGKSVLSDRQIPDPVKDALTDGMARSAESPRQIGLDRRAGVRAPRRTF
jgi:hypothetical protein